MRHTYPPPFSSFLDVSVSRAVDTDYQNNSGKIMMVMVSFQAFVTDITDYAWLEGRVLDSAPATAGYIHGKGGIYTGTPANTAILVSMPLVVPPFWYYRFKRLVSAGGMISSLRVVEVS